MIDERTRALGRAAGGALLGVDTLFRAESGDGDGLAVLNMARPGELPPEVFADYGEAEHRFTALRFEAAALAEADRRRYYDQLCHSTLAFIRWRSEGLGFEDRLADFLHVPSEPAPDAALDALRSSMHTLLGRMGYHGDLAARCRAWEERHRVEPAAVPEVLSGFLDEAWDRTEEHVIEIPAPRADGMRVRAVSGVPYNARCDYLARTIELNTDPVLTAPALKHLAVHEGYPGHYLQFKLRETLVREGTAAADVLLSVVNTASSSVFEGIADSGLAVIGWGDSDDDRLQGLLNRYRAGIGTVAAWRLHALGRPADEVADWLRGQALVGGEGWVANRMRFIAEPSRAVLIWSYWWGEAAVAPAWAAVAAEHREGFVRYLYGRMHSIDTVAMYAPD